MTLWWLANADIHGKAEEEQSTSPASPWRRQPSAARGAARGTRFGADGARPVGRSGPSFAPRPPPRTGPAASLAMASAGRRGLLLPSLRPRAEDVLSSRKGRADRPHRHPFLIPCLPVASIYKAFSSRSWGRDPAGRGPRRWPRQCVQRPTQGWTHQPPGRPRSQGTYGRQPPSGKLAHEADRPARRAGAGEGFLRGTEPHPRIPRTSGSPTKKPAGCFHSAQPLEKCF